MSMARLKLGGWEAAMGIGMIVRTPTNVASNFMDTCISKSVYATKAVEGTYAQSILDAACVHKHTCSVQKRQMQDVSSTNIHSTSCFVTNSISSKKTRGDTKETDDDRMLLTRLKLDAC